jgi:hypothetical protein
MVGFLPPLQESRRLHLHSGQTDRPRALSPSPPWRKARQSVLNVHHLFHLLTCELPLPLLLWKEQALAFPGRSNALRERVRGKRGEAERLLLPLPARFFPPSRSSCTPRRPPSFNTLTLPRLSSTMVERSLSSVSAVSDQGVETHAIST